MPTLGVDIDSTIWDTLSRVREAVLEVTGETLDPAKTSTWTHLLEAYGERATAEVYERVLSPKSIAERRPYPHAPEVLRTLHTRHDIEVHFITRSSDTRPVEPHLKVWLHEHFGPGVAMTVTAGDKLEVLRDIRAFGLIDDRPETLVRAAGARLWIAARMQPWNKTFVAKNPDVLGFYDWRELPNLLPQRVLRRAPTRNS